MCEKIWIRPKCKSGGQLRLHDTPYHHGRNYKETKKKTKKYKIVTRRGFEPGSPCSTGWMSDPPYTRQSGGDYAPHRWPLRNSHKWEAAQRTTTPPNPAIWGDPPPARGNVCSSNQRRNNFNSSRDDQLQPVSIFCLLPEHCEVSLTPVCFLLFLEYCEVSFTSAFFLPA